VARNLRLPHGEIDIIARDGQILVFVEVKTRRDERTAAPIQSVTAAKQRKIVRLAEAYLVRFRGKPPRCRFDVVEVVLPRFGRSVLRHHRDAFRAH
jgi:putative endonuclease